MRKMSIGNIEYLLHLFFLFLIRHTDPLPPESSSALKREIYFFKIAGLLWFDDEPQVGGIQRIYFLNRNFSSEAFTQDVTGLTALNAPTLEFLSKKMQKPDWATEENKMKGLNFCEFWRKVTGESYENKPNTEISSQLEDFRQEGERL